MSEYLKFLSHVEPLKHDLRFTTNPFVTRKDNVGSHSWRAGLLALFIDQIVTSPIDRQRVMDLIENHDLVEYGKGGTQAMGFRDEAQKDQQDETADLSIFSYLPPVSYARIVSLYNEFVKQETFESRVAKALERLESNQTAIESIDAIKDPIHKEKTIKYIKKFLGIDPGLDNLIKSQLKLIYET